MASCCGKANSYSFSMEARRSGRVVHDVYGTSDRADDSLLLNLHNDDLTFTLCKWSQSSASHQAEECQTRQLLIKCETRFCYCIVGFLPEKFSETYFKVLFSCNTRMWPGRHFFQPKPSTAQLAATSPTSWRQSTFICSVQTDMKSIQDNITSHASASVRLSFGTMVLSATAHGRS